MKPLLTTILLLLCSLTWGQETYKADDGRVYKYYEGDSTIDATIMSYSDNYTETVITPPIITMNDILDYSDECYSDSTWVEPYWGADPVYNTMLRYYSGKWEHKQPTFAGFIEWLERKYLEEQP